MSLPSREAWIEIQVAFVPATVDDKSLPSREAWIEISPPSCEVSHQMVASLAGSVD